MGPQGKQFEFVPCGPTLRDSNNRTTERGGWALPRQKIRDHIFLQSHRARALSLTSDLVARIRCSHRRNPTTITGQEPKPCFKPLQAEATGDQFQILLSSHHRTTLNTHTHTHTHTHTPLTKGKGFQNTLACSPIKLWAAARHECKELLTCLSRV